MKINTAFLVVIVVCFSGIGCWGKDLGTITLKQQSAPIFASSSYQAQIDLINHSESQIQDLKIFDSKLINGWVNMARKISKQVHWNKEIGFVLSNSKSREVGLKINGNGEFKISIVQKNGNQILSGISPEKGIYTGYQFGF